MFLESLLDKTTKWKNWEKDHNTKHFLELEKILTECEEPPELFLSGDGNRATLVLNSLLGIQLISHAGIYQSDLLFTIKYGSETSYKAVFHQGNPQNLNVKSFEWLLFAQEGTWQKARAQLKQIDIKAPIPVLKNVTIVFNPLSPQSKGLSLINEPTFPLVLLILGNHPPTKRTINTLSKLMAMKNGHLWVEGGGKQFSQVMEKYEQVQYIQSFDSKQIIQIRKQLNDFAKKDTFRMNKLYELLATPLHNMYDDFYSQFEEIIEPLLQAEKDVRSNGFGKHLSLNKAFLTWDNRQEQLKRNLQEWNHVTISDMPTLTKAYEEIEKVAATFQDQRVQHQFSHLQHDWEEIVRPSYREFVKQTKYYLNDAKKQGQLFDKISSKFRKEKKRLFFLRKVEEYQEEIEKYQHHRQRLSKHAERVNHHQEEMIDILDRFANEMKTTLQVICHAMDKRTSHEKKKLQLNRKELSNHQHGFSSSKLEAAIEWKKNWKAAMANIEPLFIEHGGMDSSHFQHSYHLYENIKSLGETVSLEGVKSTFDQLSEEVASAHNQAVQIYGPTIKFEELENNPFRFLHKEINIDLSSFIKHRKRRRDQLVAVILLSMTLIVGNKLLKPQEVYSENNNTYSQLIDSATSLTEDFVGNNEEGPSTASEQGQEDISGFLLEYRDGYMSSLNEMDITYVEAYVTKEGTAYEAIFDYIESIKEKGLHFEQHEITLIDSQVLENNRYQVETNERFYVTDDQGNQTYQERKKRYIIAESANYFEIESFERIE